MWKNNKNKFTSQPVKRKTKYFWVNLKSLSSECKRRRRLRQRATRCNLKTIKRWKLKQQQQQQKEEVDNNSKTRAQRRDLKWQLTREWSLTLHSRRLQFNAAKNRVASVDEQQATSSDVLLLFRAAAAGDGGDGGFVSLFSVEMSS